MSKKRRRDASTVDVKLVEIYEDLAHESEDIRLKAAASLLSKLSPDQTPNKDHVLGALTRLIRGLCSPRKAARLGFSIALTEFLAQTQGSPGKNEPPQLDTQEVIDVLKKQTVVEGNAAGTEAKNYDFGRLFGAEAIIKSGVLFRSHVSVQLWVQIVNLLLDLGRRTWLRKECGWVLYSAIGTLGKHEDYVQVLIDKVSEHGLAKTPEGVAIWIRAQSMDPEMRFPEGIWHGDDPLHPKEKTRLAQIFKEVPSTKSGPMNEAELVNQKGNRSPELNFAWQVVMDQLLKEQQPDIIPLKGRIRHLTFQEFWLEAADDGLFASSSTEQRKNWGFTLFQRLLRDVATQLLPTLFSENFIRCLMNQVASCERYLHAAAKKTVKGILARVEREPSAAITVVSALTRLPQGPVNFDQITKTKTIEKLLAHVQDHSLMNLLTLYSQLMLKATSQDEKTRAASLRMAADQLMAVLKTRLLKASTEAQNTLEYNDFVSRTLALFANYGYFAPERSLTPKSDGESTLSESSREMFRSRILSCLSIVLAKSLDPAHFSYNLILYIRTKEKEDSNLRSLFQSEQAVKKTVDKAWVTLHKIHAKRMTAQGPRQRLLIAFDLLYALTLLQVYNGEAEAVGILDELKSSYDNLLKHKQISDNGRSDALIEILLSFASKPSLLFRRLAQQVFSACTSDVSGRGLQSMTKVLETRETLAGQEEIFEQEANESQGESSGDDLSDISDVSMVAAGLDDKNGDGSEDSPALSDDGTNDGHDEELAVFDAKLALALGTRPATDALAADDSEGTSDSDMDDEQMEALDEHLEKVFRERKNLTSKKTQNKDAKEAIVNFKCRVLELLDIFVKEQHTNALALDLLIPLLDVIRLTKSPLVSTRACDLVRKYSMLCKAKSMPVLADSRGPLELLKEVHGRAGREGSNAYGAACSQASLLLVKILAAQDRENLRLAEAVYGETHQAFMFDSKSKVKPSFFSDWLNWSVSVRKA